jgi:hypothetical protein
MKHRFRSAYALPYFVIVMLVLLAGAYVSASAGPASWLDSKTMHNWNKIAEAIPKAPPPVGDPATSGSCARTVRPPSTREDRALASAGWKLFRPYELYGATSLVAGMASVDGMCRPLQFNVFVFFKGQFAGTISPVLMNSRTDGGLQETYLTDSAHLMATFSRYSGSEQLCCPSRVSTVEYTINVSHSMPVVLPLDVTTSPSGQ